MLEIPFILVPLIVTSLVALATYISNGFSFGEPQSETAFVMYIILTLAMLTSGIYYMIMGLQWIDNHVTIVY
jgi:hypothetical protein